MLPAFQDAAKGRWFWKDEYGTSLLGDIRWLRSLKRKRIFGFLACHVDRHCGKLSTLLGFLCSFYLHTPHLDMQRPRAQVVIKS